MKAKIKAGRALLGIASAVGLLSAFANNVPTAPALPAKKLESREYQASSAAANEEMVSRLIIKHRSQRNDKLGTVLQTTQNQGVAIPFASQMSIIRPMSGGAHVVSLDQPVTLAQAQVIAERLRQNKDIELAEPDRVLRVMTTVTPTDPAYATHQWHYKAPLAGNAGGANLPHAWWMTTGAPAIRVAVLDTGYRQHEDFGTAPGNILPGYDFIKDTAFSNDGDERDADASDPGDFCSTDASPKSSWHGTHVAGTIGARMNNTIAGKQHGTGIAPLTSILPIRVIGRCGGRMSDIVDGMRWAAGLNVPGEPNNPTPAHLLNLSIGGSGACSAVFQSAINDVINAGKTIVVAAGNDSTIGLSQPANCNGVIAVTAHVANGDNASYASISGQVAISAPGGGCGTMATGCTPLASPGGLGIYSLSNSGSNAPGADNYNVRAGSSMAAPHVSGVVALMLALKPALTPLQIRSYLQSSARTHPAGTTCTQSRYLGLCGEGMLDAFGALSKAADEAPIVGIVNAYQVVAPNAVVSLSSTDSVAPGSGRTIISSTWSQQTGTGVGAINGSNTPNATFSAPMTGTYTFLYTVTDSAGKTAKATATVRVNSPPVLTAIADQVVTPGTTVRFTVAASDPDGDPVMFVADALPHANASLDPATGVFTWPDAAAGSYSLTYRAIDRDAASASGTVKITVAAPTKSGGGSISGASLIGLALLAGWLRIRRKRV